MILDKVVIVVCCLATAAFAEEASTSDNKEAVRTTRNVLLPPYYNNGQYYDNGKYYNDGRYYNYPWNYNQQPYRHHPHYPLRSPFTGAVNPNDHQSPVLYSNDVRHPDGSYFYEFETANGIRRLENSVQTPSHDNVVQGSYSHVGPDGRTYTVNYIADKDGYRAFGDHLPQQPHSALSPIANRPIVVTTPKPSAGHNKIVVTPAKLPTAFPQFNYNQQPAFVHPYSAYSTPYNPYATARPFLGHHGSIDHPYALGRK